MASSSNRPKSDDRTEVGGERNLDHVHKKACHYSPNKRREPHSNRYLQQNDIRRSTPKLPVQQYKGQFLKLFNDSKALVIVGETGSGKTTQIPQWCLDTTKGKAVACTQPRRIAAMSVAARVAEERGVDLGREVGYSVRFDSCCSPQTVLKYLTDGMLLREAMVDSRLSSYEVIILDEAHERTLQTEILFGVIKLAMNARNNSDTGLPPLRIIVMSATINVKLFKSYFKAPILKVEGRQHPVQDMFATVSQSDMLASTLTVVFQIHRQNDEGDVLVFCSGVDEIQSLITYCKKLVKKLDDSLQNITFLPLHASLPASHQMRVFDHTPSYSQVKGTIGNAPSFNRRVIFATNVAETSVTIPNIKYVIDTGKVKCRAYCPKTGLESLKITTISKAQAKQRSGRAGRVAPGTCFRLYTEEEFDEMSNHLLPEIKRCSLDGVILQMISIGIKEIGSFEFLDKPENARINSAISNLLALKAIKISAMIKSSDKVPPATNSCNQPPQSSSNSKKTVETLDDENILNLSYELTNIGKKICAFPLDPAMGRIILAANQLNCLDEALTVVSLLSVENLFHIPPSKEKQAEEMLNKFRSNEGDTIMLLKLFKSLRKVLSIKGTTAKKAALQDWYSNHFINTKNLKLARLIRKQLLDLCQSLGMKNSSCGDDTTILRRALTYGLFNNVATMWNGKYRNKFCDDIHIHPSSCLFKLKPECILYTEIVETNKCYMRTCTLIDMSWVREISSANINQSTTATTSR